MSCALRSTALEPRRPPDTAILPLIAPPDTMKTAILACLLLAGCAYAAEPQPAGGKGW